MTKVARSEGQQFDCATWLHKARALPKEEFKREVEKELTAREPQDKQAGGGTEKAVAAMEQQWLQSQKANNPDLVAPLLADKFTGTDSEGKVRGKAESLANAKATKYDSVDYDDVKVTAFGDTAIATGGFNAKGTDASGKPLDVHERWTDTWMKMSSGKWQCVASHSSPVKM